jgi:Apolipoprotein N-acyltransferase N-terminal domain
VRERVLKGRGRRAQRSCGAGREGADRAEAVGRSAGGGWRRCRCAPRVPQSGLWWSACAALVPVLLLVEAAPSRREALWRCWSAGCGYFLVLYHWLLPQLSVFVVPLVLAVGLGWLPWGMAAWWLLRDPWSHRRVAAALVVVPSAWEVVECLRSWYRLGGSWGLLGTSQWQVRPILVVTALGGVWGTFVPPLCTGTALAVVVRPGTAWGMRLGAAAVVSVLIGGAAGYRLSRSDPDVQGTLRIGGVQPGVVEDRRERLAATRASAVTSRRPTLTPSCGARAASGSTSRPSHGPVIACSRSPGSWTGRCSSTSTPGWSDREDDGRGATRRVG